MPRILLAIAVIYLAVLIYTVFDIVLRDRALIKVMPKAAWAAVVILLPVIGVILWYLFGRVSAATAGPQRGIAPDDDPDYLRKISEDIEFRRSRERNRGDDEAD